MDRPGHVGVAMPLRQLTQVTLLARLVGLAAGLLARNHAGHQQGALQ